MEAEIRACTVHAVEMQCSVLTKRMRMTIRAFDLNLTSMHVIARSAVQLCRINFANAAFEASPYRVELYGVFRDVHANSLAVCVKSFPVRPRFSDETGLNCIKESSLTPSLYLVQVEGIRGHKRLWRGRCQGAIV